MEGILFLFIIFSAALLILNKHIKWWIKLLIVGYYAVLFYFFTKGYNKIYDDFDKVRSKGNVDDKTLQDYWHTNSDYVDIYYGFIVLPVLALLLYSYYVWIKKSKNKKSKFLLALSILPVFILYLWITILVGMLGYYP